ncbi:MAG: fimbrillin family protein, partial [Bacteroidales bacterium]|nr:fimbrillin family protein [Bacteroidales bacterium]
MKRLILLATMMVAVLASCEKHEIRNEVINEIGFTQKVGKQTKAIVSNTYNDNQPFGVYAYSVQTVDNTTNTATVMPNVEIVKNDSWKANTTHGKFYWPNDSRTTLSFYAYSPYLASEDGIASSATDNDKKINGIITHSENNGLKLEGYVHSNQYVDFMVADPVT